MTRVARAVAGENLFVTGGAGTGKTETLRRIYRELRSRGRGGAYRNYRDGSKAPGRENIGELCWIWSRSFATEVLRRAQANAKAVARWRQTRTLIIDEISVMHGRMADIMNCLAKYLQGNRSRFGGLQVISGGFQLPPVVEKATATVVGRVGLRERHVDQGKSGIRCAADARVPPTRRGICGDPQQTPLGRSRRQSGRGWRCWQRSSSFPSRRCTCGLCGSRWTRRILRASRLAGPSVRIPIAGFRSACAVYASLGGTQLAS
jgi:hypothetical protein